MLLFLLVVLAIGVIIQPAVAVVSNLFGTSPVDDVIVAEDTRIPDVQQISLSMKKVEKLVTNEVRISFPMKHTITIQKHIFGLDCLYPDWTEEVELQLNGKVSLGLNLSVFKPSDIAVARQSRKIVIRLPAVQILDTSIDSNTVQVVGRNGNHYIGDYHKELISRALKKAQPVMMQIYRCQMNAGDKAVNEAKASADLVLFKLVGPLAVGYAVDFVWRVEGKP
jgi:hypothetical protein